MMDAERAVGAREYRARMQSMNAVQRHREHMEVLKLYGGSPAPPTQPTLSDYDILRQEHRFIRDDERDARTHDWKVQMARSYYNKLYRFVFVFVHDRPRLVTISAVSAAQRICNCRPQALQKREYRYALAYRARVHQRQGTGMTKCHRS